MPDRVAKRLLDGWTERLAPVAKERALAWWEVNLAATPANSARYRKALEAMEAAGRDAEGFGKIGRALEEGVADPVLRRALVVLRSTLLPFQGPSDVRLAIAALQTRVQERYSNVRGTIAGKPVSDNEIDAILGSSDDAKARRAAWEASKEVGAAVAADVRELARLRNRNAKALGFDDHYAMELSRQEVDATWLDGFLDRMEAGTSPAFDRYKGALDARLAKRFATTPDSLRPWHYDDPFFQKAPAAPGGSLDRFFEGRDLVALTNRTYAPMGFDLGPVLAGSDLLPRAGKCQHAFCSHVDREGDVRVLCNCVPGERWAGTMLHEFGHAVYDRHIAGSLPWAIRTPPHMSSTEAIAMLFGRLVHDPAWLRPVLGLSAADAKAAAEAGTRSLREGLLVFTRWVQVMARFEKAMYADPERDLDSLWWDLVERYQRVRRPDGRKAPDWAAKIHIATAPVYYHAYLMGEATASQIARAIRRDTGDGLVDSAKAGAWLRDKYFAPGSTHAWDGHVAASTGSALDEAHLLADMGVS